MIAELQIQRVNKEQRDSLVFGTWCRSICLLFLLLLELPADLLAQDAQFSQYYTAPLYVSPAYAGLEPYITANANYRSQWSSIVQPYLTSQLSLIVPVQYKKSSHPHRGGVGLSVYNDQAGEGSLKTLGVNISFAYNLPLSSDEYHFFSFGLQAGFIQKNIDFSSGSGWGSQFNPAIGFDPSLPMDGNQFNGKTIYPDLGAGVIWHNNAIKNYDTRKTSSYLGFSVQHLNTPDESLLINQSSRLPRLFRLHGGVEFRLSPHFRISPNVIALQQNQAYQFNGGVYLTYAAFEATKGVMQEAAIVLGSWYRYGDAVIFSTGLNSRYYALGFSYDLNNSSLRYITHGRGAYEVSLSAKIFRAKNTPTEKAPTYHTPRFRR